MALSYRTRKRLSLLILMIGLPAYIGAAWFLVSLFERPSILLELLIYVVLGVVWALPFRAVFRGVGKADPDAEADTPPRGP
ncbi:MAG: DUF2842 domain-containing protein [Pseudomonadota bacterium]